MTLPMSPASFHHPSSCHRVRNQNVKAAHASAHFSGGDGEAERSRYSPEITQQLHLLSQEGKWGDRGLMLEAPYFGDGAERAGVPHVPPTALAPALSPASCEDWTGQG